MARIDNTQAIVDATMQSGAPVYTTASGTDTYTADLTPPIADYIEGSAYNIKFTNPNTGASTINLNSLGAKDIKKADGSALVAGDILAGQISDLFYNGTYFQLGTSVSGSGGSGIVMTPATILDNQATPQLLFEYDAATYPYVFLLHSVVRGVDRDIYYQQLVTDGVNVSGGANKNSIGVTGVTLSKQVLAGKVQILYTSTNTGVGGTYKYGFVNRWS